MSFLYPLIGDRTLLSVYVKPERVALWGDGAGTFGPLLDQFRVHLPDMDLSSAEPESRMFGYRKYDNRLRPPVTGGVAFVGDASVSVDPMSGVGCSFALKAARMLADAVLGHPDDPEAAMAAYAGAHEDFFPPHVAGIVADSRVAKSEAGVAETYANILRDEALKRRYLALTARLITPAAFQKSYLMSVARAAARHQPPSQPPSRARPVAEAAS